MLVVNIFCSFSVEFTVVKQHDIYESIYTYTVASLALYK